MFFPRLLVLFPTKLPYLNICSDPLAPNVGYANCPHVFSHLCFHATFSSCFYSSSAATWHSAAQFCLSMKREILCFPKQSLRSRLVYFCSHLFHAETQFCSTILSRPVVSSSSFSEDFRRDYYLYNDVLQLSEMEFCRPASAQVCYSARASSCP